MQVLTNWQLFPRAFRGGVLCIGNFDGVHLGHARMLATGREQATARRESFTIMTFDPHPSLLLKPAMPRIPLTTLPQRIEILQTFSPDVLLILPTTPEFLALPAEDFLHGIVCGTDSSGLAASLLVEGTSFTYGQGAKGTVETLRQRGSTHGFETLIIPTLEQSLTDLSLVKVSSTLIRWLISQGRVADAARALGRAYTLRGTVVEGQRRGRTIGFPTANLASEQLIPAPGVYAGTARVDGAIYAAAISVGTNPTFEKTGGTTVEAYLLDFAGDLYGKTIDVGFQRWIREMYTFSGPGPLVTQMNRDVALVRRHLTPLVP